MVGKGANLSERLQILKFEVLGTKKYGLHVRGRNRRLPDYCGIDLGHGLNTTMENTRSARWRSAKDEG